MTTPPVRDERRVADAIVAALAEAGVEYVLGMPGGYTGGIFSSLHDHPSIRTIQVREESIGSAMAEAYGRLTGRPLVVMGQGEWIAGNAGQGFMEALLGSSPVVILTDMTDGGPLSHHAPYQSGTGDYGTWDARSTLAGVSKRVMVSHHPAQAVQHTQLALKHALTGEPGPVSVIFHSSSLRGSVDPTAAPRLYPTDRYLPRPSRALDAGAVDQAARALREAERPVVVAGNGVRVGQAWEALARFAVELDLPVVTSASGKGVFDETHPLAAGVIGSFGWASANEVAGGADLVVAVGTKLGPHDTADANPDLFDPARQTFVQIDVEPLNASWSFPVDHVLVGDAAFQLDQLRQACGALGAPPRRPQPGAARVAEAISRHGELEAPEFSADDVPLAPQRIISVLHEALPDRTMISCDAGENRLFMMHWFRSRVPGSYLQPAAGGGMGYSVPAAMAAKLAHPERPALAVCGDGGFAMSLHALMTAVQEDLPIGVLVFNNGALGWVLHGMGERAIAADFASFDHEAIASALGCDAVRVTSTAVLRDAVKSLADLSRPLVIDVPTSLATSFRDVTQDIARQRRGSGY
jgi:acetolactate synthase I/II/III large subunit